MKGENKIQFRRSITLLSRDLLIIIPATPIPKKIQSFQGLSATGLKLQLDFILKKFEWLLTTEYSVNENGTIKVG
jgi:hypothetical protein